MEKATSEDVSESVDAHSHECHSAPVCPDGETLAITHPRSHDHAHIHSHVDQPEHQSRVAIVSMDTLGIFASTLCLIHCLAMPLVVAFLPILGLQFLEGHAAHQILAGFVVCFGLLAILPGYMKHRRPLVLAGLVTGLVLVLTATFGYLGGLTEEMELPLITVGNLVLVASHWFNRQLCKCSHY